MRSSALIHAAGGLWLYLAISTQAAPVPVASLAIFATSYGLSLQIFQFIAVGNHFLEQFIQFVVAVELAKKIDQSLPGFEKLLQRLDLLDDVCGIEVIHVSKLQLDVDLAAIIGQLIIRTERCSGSDRSENIVVVISIDLNKFPVFHFREGLGGLPREIRENTDDKGQFLLLGGIANFDVVRDLNSGRTYTV